jgi:peptidoglycan/xylan/chitin deacetylase (PgdA/CDA1 family)
VSILILMYHGVDRAEGPLFVDPALFSDQMKAIAASGLPVLTIGEIGDRLREGRLPAGAVALTFDDAFASVVEEAAPRLQEHGLRATVFCVAGRIGGTNAWPTARIGAPQVDLADAAGLARLVEQGFEIGSHGIGHAPLDTTDEDEIRREVAASRAELERMLGVQVPSFAYPYGATASAAARRQVSTSYTAACTTRIGRVEQGTDPLALPRVDAYYLRSPRRFEAVLEGRAGGYLALRRFAASTRRRVRHDYVRRSEQ